jgi:hypothetical protein
VSNLIPRIKGEEHLLRVLKTVLRRMCGPKMDEVAGGWRRLHNEELHDLYAASHFIRVIKSIRIRWVGHVACVGEIRSAYNILVGKPERSPCGDRGKEQSHCSPCMS